MKYEYHNVCNKCGGWVLAGVNKVGKTPESQNFKEMMNIYFRWGESTQMLYCENNCFKPVVVPILPFYDERAKAGQLFDWDIESKYFTKKKFKVICKKQKLGKVCKLEEADE